MTTRELLPHLLSASRPAIGFVLLASIPARFQSPWVLVAVLAACFSDWLDGRLARRAGSASTSGRLVDNFCDFFFLLFVFACFARGQVWSPPFWGRLAHHWSGANALPVYALLGSFGSYALRLVADFARGREPMRSRHGHRAGISNYGLAIAGAVELLPGVQLGPWILEPAMVGVALLNALAVVENLRLLVLPGPRATPPDGAGAA